MIHIGIDLHISNMVNSAINDNGDELWLGKIPATEAGLVDFFAQFEGSVQAVVESTGNWYWVADWCAAHHIPLTLAHAKMLKAISYAKVKTDKVDAHTLAELLRTGLIPEAHMQMGAQRALRELTRGRLRMVQRRESIQNMVWNLAAKYNVKLSEHEQGWRQLEPLQEWLEQKLPDVAHFEAGLLLDQIGQLQAHIHQIEAKLEHQVEFSEALGRLLPIPGIGLVTGWTILAEVGDIKRFPNAKKFVSYCRLAPGSKNSGGRSRHRSASKDGNKYLRMAFGQAAVSAYSQYGPVKKFYNKIKRRSGRKVARAVVAKELANIVWHVLSKQEPYKGFKGHPTRVASQPSWPQPISLPRKTGARLRSSD